VFRAQCPYGRASSNLALGTSGAGLFAASRAALLVLR
jgi:hypothetical protein